MGFVEGQVALEGVLFLEGGGNEIHFLLGSNGAACRAAAGTNRVEKWKLQAEDWFSASPGIERAAGI